MSTQSVTLAKNSAQATRIAKYQKLLDQCEEIAHEQARLSQRLQKIKDSHTLHAAKNRLADLS